MTTRVYVVFYLLSTTHSMYVYISERTDGCSFVVRCGLYDSHLACVRVHVCVVLLLYGVSLLVYHSVWHFV